MKPINFLEYIMGFLTHMQLLEGQGANWTSINSISLSLSLECTILYMTYITIHTSYVIKKTPIRQFHEIWTILIDKK
jgi:hypothetical protein